MKGCHGVCLVLAQLIAAAASSQFYFSSGNKPEPELLWEMGASAGGINCLTDIGGNNGRGKKFIKDLNLPQTQLCVSLLVAATWQSTIAVRFEAMTGRLSGTDQAVKNSADEAINRYRRNLHFRTSITECSLLAELHVLALSATTSLPLFSPYLAAGTGFCYYNPQARLNNAWIDLRPLHTEGQGFEEYRERINYRPVTWCLPFGAGIKYDAGSPLTVRLEFLYRFTGTDYLDDVSSSYIDPALFGKYLSATQAAFAAQLADRSAELPGGIKNAGNSVRGNPSNKDAYFSCMLKIAVAPGRLRRK